MPRVLIIDDDCGITSALEAALTMEGYEVEVQPDGLAGLGRLQAPPAPDVVLLDLAMPRLSGTEVIEAMNLDPRLRDLPVVVMTAAARPDLPPRPGGFPAVLRKPFQLGALLEVLTSLPGPKPGTGRDRPIA